MKILNWLKGLLGLNYKSIFEQNSMKYLIVGLGNVGAEYQGTRHNIGFDVVDFIVEQAKTTFSNKTLADVAEVKHRGRNLVLIKPTTFMNRSGKAVNYWMDKYRIPKERVLIVLDDLNLDFGTIRLRAKGSDGGHNGLKDIDQALSGNNYARLRIGIGNKFHKGQQVNFVLGKWSEEENKYLDQVIRAGANAAKSFAAIGLKFTMEKFNRPIQFKESSK
jgi:PTH1 family peptidyl-tRNA hydrolase